jgi:deoxycytidylate deaminase
MKMAHLIAGRSKDVSFQAGAVLVANDNRTVLGLGFNGAPPQIKDDYDQTNRPLTRALTCHAESNCLYYAAAAHGREKLDGSILYVCGRPCHSCVKEAVRAGCEQIIWDDTNPSQPKMADEEDWEKSRELEFRSGTILVPYSTIEGD